SDLDLKSAVGRGFRFRKTFGLRIDLSDRKVDVEVGGCSGDHALKLPDAFVHLSLLTHHRGADDLERAVVRVELDGFVRLRHGLLWLAIEPEGLDDQPLGPRRLRLAEG